jgi:hypothetical protein
MKRQAQTKMVKRVYDYAGVIRAECDPMIPATQAISIALRFIVLIEEIRRLKRELHEEAR